MTKNFNLTRAILILVFVIIWGMLLYAFNVNKQVYISDSATAGDKYEKAEVINVISEDITSNEQLGNIKFGSQNLEIKILTGQHKGEIKTVQNFLSETHNVYATSGTKIIVNIQTANADNYEINVYNYYRAPIQYAFIIIFFVALSIIGGKKGFKSVLGLLFTFINIIFLFIPMLYQGYSPIYATFLITVLVTCASLILLDGISPKTLSAILGTICGTVLAALIAMLVGDFAHLNGYNTSDVDALIMISKHSSLKIKNLLLSGVIIASLGAVMDLSMSIASAVQEIYISNRNVSFKDLFNSGMNVGKDMMGTMANTLILAFTGSSLSMIILIYSYNVSFNQLINMDMVNIEILQGLTGSLAIILTVPIIAIISSFIIPKMLKKSPVT